MQNTTIQQTKPKREMLNYINVFIVLAILLIVVGHTMQFGNPGTWPNNIAFEIFTGGTALFVFQDFYSNIYQTNMSTKLI